METLSIDQPRARKPLRVWPGVAIVVLQWMIWFVLPQLFKESDIVPIAASMGNFVALLAVAVWWAGFSRAPWVERVLGLVLLIAAPAATWIVADNTMSGPTGVPIFVSVVAVPLSLAFVLWAAFGRRLASRRRMAWLPLALVLGCLPGALVRSGGFGVGLDMEFRWRWSPSAEDRVLALSSNEELPAAELQPVDLAPVWPGFRGAERDGRIHGVRIATDWAASPPVELWRRPVGPGWSSFAVAGDLAFTQEQRGNEEVVAAYRVTTGEPVWLHKDEVRFFEALGGVGPRATPAFADGRVYAFGATGVLNALDAGSGKVLWSRDVSKDSGVAVPTWGFASSPLVMGDIVVVAAGGKLAAYAIANGEPRWFGPIEGEGYSSPQRMTIGGIEQIVMLSSSGSHSVSPADGSLLWKDAWPGSIVQPGMTESGDVLVADPAKGLECLTVAHDAGGWSVKERWNSNDLKAWFNDYVVHEGYAYGIDGVVLGCFDLANGERVWKGGRFGSGQLFLLADQDVLLVISDKGELGLVEAKPEGFNELGRFQAIRGKTWNHPVLAGDVLLVRNGEEMAAFRLKLASD